MTKDVVDDPGLDVMAEFGAKHLLSQATAQVNKHVAEISFAIFETEVDGEDHQILSGNTVNALRDLANRIESLM